MDDMTKQQASAEIAQAEQRAKDLQNAASQLRETWFKSADAAQKISVDAIRKKFDRQYSTAARAAKERADAAFAAITALKIRHAKVLCDFPIDSVMVEWIQEWTEWKATGRTGKLEVYLEGAEWTEGNYDRPSIGTVIIRVVGKNGRPTKNACRLSKSARDGSFRKYLWLPKGTEPKKIA